MSVSFFCPDAPTASTPCEWCEDARSQGKRRDDWPYLDGKMVQDEAVISSWTDVEWSRTTCSPWCKGSKETSVAPEANFANANARSLLALLGLDAEELYGSASPEECREVLQKIMLLTNKEGAVSHLDREATDERRTRIETVGGMPTFKQGPRMIGVPNTSADTLRRIEYLREIFSYGASNHTKVCWG